MSKVKIYSRYSVPPQVGLDTGSESIVDKDSLQSSDINFIVQRYSDTGELPVSYNRPIYGDFSKEFTFQEVFDLTADLRNLYDSMPEDKRSNLDYSDFVKSLAFDDEDKIGSMFGLQHGPTEDVSAEADTSSSNLESSEDVSSDVPQ